MSARRKPSARRTRRLPAHKPGKGAAKVKVIEMGKNELVEVIGQVVGEALGIAVAGMDERFKRLEAFTGVAREPVNQAAPSPRRGPDAPVEHIDLRMDYLIKHAAGICDQMDVLDSVVHGTLCGLAGEEEPVPFHSPDGPTMSVLQRLSFILIRTEGLLQRANTNARKVRELVSDAPAPAGIQEARR